MKAMILAAGRGERMRPLTDHTPKPLLQVCGKPLIQHHIERLAKAGFKHLVINYAWLGSQIEQAMGDGSRFGVQIHYSDEGEQGLETAGGIYRALPFLGDTFLVVNGDVLLDYDFTLLPREPEGKAHLVLVDNPPHNPSGDFAIEAGLARSNGAPKYTFSGLAVYRSTMFGQCQPGKFPLAPLLVEHMAQDLVTAEHYDGFWMDIGTPERLQQANQEWQLIN